MQPNSRAVLDSAEKQYSASLDATHRQFMEKFKEQDMNILPQLKKRHKALVNSLKNTHDIDKQLEINDTISELLERIKSLEYNKKKYLLKNSKYVFNYFEERKNIDSQNIDVGDQPSIAATVEDSTAPSVISKKNAAMLKFFNLDKKTDNNVSDSKNKPVKQTMVLNNIKRYLKNVDSNFVDSSFVLNESDICLRCKNGEMVPMDDEGVLICNNEKCRVTVSHLVENEKPSYKDTPREVCFYVYRRSNHFKEIVAQFQGKETTTIPEVNMEQIKKQVKRERLAHEELTHDRMRFILRNLGLSKYYEHVPLIKKRMGIPPPIFSKEMEEMLYILFLETQLPYTEVCPETRFNFLSYHFTLYKLCELMGETSYLPNIPLLKDREKLVIQDEIWKSICGVLNWDFYPTI
jgi:hypothetical protein